VTTTPPSGGRHDAHLQHSNPCRAAGPKQRHPTHPRLWIQAPMPRGDQDVLRATTTIAWPQTVQKRPASADLRAEGQLLAGRLRRLRPASEAALVRGFDLGNFPLASTPELVGGKRLSEPTMPRFPTRVSAPRCVQPVCLTAMPLPSGCSSNGAHGRRGQSGGQGPTPWRNTTGTAGLSPRRHRNWA